MSEFEERQVSWRQRSGFAETERVQSWFYCKRVHGIRWMMFVCLKSLDCISKRGRENWEGRVLVCKERKENWSGLLEKRGFAEWW